jgi:hypothetical protein
MSILRLAERVMGEGDIHRSGASLGRVGYELSRYEQVDVEGSELRPRGHLVEGHLHAPPGLLALLPGTEAPLTLHLDDGRHVDVYVLGAEGVITSADERGFY